MRNIEFYGGFVKTLLVTPPQSAHDIQLRSVILEALDATQDIVSRETPRERFSRAHANLTFFDEELEKVGSFPPTDSPSHRNASQRFVRYIEEHPDRDAFLKERGIDLLSYRHHASEESMSSVGYVSHRGMLNQVVKDFVHDVVNEAARSPRVAEVMKDSALSDEERREFLIGLAMDSLEDKLEADRAPDAGPQPGR